MCARSRSPALVSMLLVGLGACTDRPPRAEGAAAHQAAPTSSPTSPPTPSSAPSVAFLRRSPIPLSPNPAQRNYGVAVTDVDGDGTFEFVVAGFGAPNRAYRYRDGRLLDVAGPVLADADRRAIGVAACDTDGDGDEELYVLNTDTYAGPKAFGDRLFERRGEEMVDLFSLPENEDALNRTAGRSVACVDRDGDGSYGVFVANYGGPMRLYEREGRGRIRDVASMLGVDRTTGGRALVSAPLVSTGMDLFAANERGPNFLFVHDGAGGYDERATPLGLADPREHGRGIAVLDANDDGALDLAYGNWEGPHRLFVRQGERFRDMAPPAMAAPSKVRTVIAADFDNDGYEELFFNNIGEPNRLFGRTADGRWTALDAGDAIEATGLGTGGAVADIDGDGRLELLLAHGESGAAPLTLFEGPENDHHWLRVRVTTSQGAPARGAVVQLRTAQRTQTRVIDAGSGYLCQMEPVAHFGLGDVERIEWVRVTFPDGAQSRRTAPRPNQVLRIRRATRRDAASVATGRDTSP